MVNKQIISDAELVKQFTEKALEEPAKEVKTESPNNLIVELPGGFLTQEGLLLKTAKVRELTGYDEEIIAKAENEGKAIQVILQRGIEELGDKKPNENDLDSLLSGDRDAILLGIRKATFGTEVEYRAVCVSCGEKQEILIDLNKDVKSKTLNDSYKRTWEVQLKNSKATLAFPNGLVQKKLSSGASSNKTLSELNTILLSGCVVAINGVSTTGPQDVLKLGIGDRDTIAMELLENNPGPRLQEVTKACKACGKDIPTPLSLAALFRV